MVRADSSEGLQFVTSVNIGEVELNGLALAPLLHFDTLLEEVDILAELALLGGAGLGPALAFDVVLGLLQQVVLAVGLFSEDLVERGGGEGGEGNLGVEMA